MMTVGHRVEQKEAKRGEKESELHLLRSSRIGMSLAASSFAGLDFEPFITASNVAGETFVYSMCFCEICDFKVTVTG
jgi:hypothetical protein